MITLDGKPIEDFGLYAKTGHSDPFPDIQNKTVNIHEMPAEYYFRSEIGSKQFSYPIGVKKVSREKAQKRISDIKALLLNQLGRPRDIELRLKYEPEKWYIVKYGG